MFQILVRTLILLSMLFSAKAFAESPDYPLGPGDILRIQVFQNPDLTTETRVSESGSITFPLVGAVEVGNLPGGMRYRLLSHYLLHIQQKKT